jgi:hypothetical protein
VVITLNNFSPLKNIQIIRRIFVNEFFEKGCKLKHERVAVQSVNNTNSDFLINIITYQALKN